jgi:immune inhibitor A
MKRLADFTFASLLIVLVVSCARQTQVPTAVTLIWGAEHTASPVVLATGPLFEAIETLSNLESTIVPLRDPIDLAMRLTGPVQSIPRLARAEAWDFVIGDRQEFWVLDWETLIHSRINAYVAYKTPHAYFFVEEGVHLDQDKLKRLAECFEGRTYPTNRKFFGEEWSPGVDGDPRLAILFAAGIDFSYQNSIDEYSRLVNQYSNEMEIIYIPARDAALDADCLLAHEFQHMIRWAADRNEPVWMNEGFATLACPLNGYDTAGYEEAIKALAEHPDIQLNDWSSGELDQAYAQYGASYLFVTYFLERFGEDALKALSRAEADGLAGVDQALESVSASLGADELFADWVVANSINDPGLADGRYGYSSLALPAFTKEAEYQENDLPVEQEASVAQYAADYIALYGPGRFQFDFTGEILVQAVPAVPHSGGYAWWSGRGTNSDTTLTRELDLSSLQRATLTFFTWYDIEPDYDYAYVEVSLDGQRWSTLQGGKTTTDNPSGANYGNGYTGASQGWIQESIDLTSYVGQKVKIRFEYLTDDGPLGAGILLDDIEIPELGYRADAEADGGGWTANGFTRSTLVLPQEWRVQLVTKRGGRLYVEELSLEPDNHGRWMIDLGRGESAVFIVAGLTRWTTERAQYKYTVIAGE